MSEEQIRITVRLPADLHAGLVRQSAEDGGSLNQQIVDRLYAGLGLTPAPKLPVGTADAVLAALEASGIDPDTLRALCVSVGEGKVLVSPPELDAAIDGRLLRHGLAALGRG